MPVAVDGQRAAVGQAVLSAANDFFEVAARLAGVASDLGHAFLVVVQLFQRDHGQVDVVFLKAEQAGRSCMSTLVSSTNSLVTVALFLLIRLSWLVGEDEIKHVLRVSLYFHFTPFMLQHASFINKKGAALYAAHLSAVHVFHFDNAE